MQTPHLHSAFRCVVFIAMLWTGGTAAAQSAADQSLKTLPQSVKDNGENKVVTKTNTVTNNSMNKLDSAGNKAFKSFTGMFKKKNKKKTDSTAPRPPDSTQGPKSSFLNLQIIKYETFGIPGSNSFAMLLRRTRTVKNNC